MKWWNVELINQPCFVMWISFFCHFKQSKKSPSASEHPVLHSRSVILKEKIWSGLFIYMTVISVWYVFSFKTYIRNHALERIFRNEFMMN